MKKSELKKVLKPLIKECIREAIFDEGVLSGIIKEVAQGMGTNMVVEAKTPRMIVIRYLGYLATLEKNSPIVLSSTYP